MKTVQSLKPVSMEEAVGYAALACHAQTPAEHALVLKHGSHFLITDPHGNVAPAGNCSLGLFQDDTRILSHYELSVRGGAPSLLAVQSPQSFVGQIDLTVTDAEFGGNAWDPKNCIHIRRELLVADRFVERLALTNYLADAIDYWVELALGCDFADIFEVRGWKREKRGQFFLPSTAANTLSLAYRGVDGVLLQSVVRFGKAPDEWNGRRVRWTFNLEPNECVSFDWQICGEFGTIKRTRIQGADFDLRRNDVENQWRQWTSECTRWNASEEAFTAVLNRAVDDLHALYIESDRQAVISAVIPWYSTVFGRDSILTSIETLPLNPRIAVDTLRYLARHQGQKEDPFTEEQPGKIMHELRRGEMARAQEIPHVPYYGTIDATPLWLVLLHETWRWTGDDDLVRELLPHAQRALDWIDRYGDFDGDGLLEYRGSPTGKGLANQGWKDSGDGVPYPDGRLPEPPIALVEVQGYAYDGLVRMAELYQMTGDRERAETLRQRAAQLRERILRQFWVEELGTFGLALDGRKHLLRTATSNAGHLLWSGVPTVDQAKRMAEHFLGPGMFCGWGIRTLSAEHRVFNPMSYHNGSVWPHDNALVVMGLARYGLTKQALPVLRGLHDAAAFHEFQRLPELFCGISRTPGMHPVWYPVSCSPQAWASGAVFMLLQAALGIEPEAPAKLIHIKNPQLPDFLEELTVSDLAIGRSKVSLQFRRHGDRTLAYLLSVSGDPLQVRIELY